MATRKPKLDPHTAIARAVERITGTEAVRGEDLIEDEGTRRLFLAAKEQEAARQANRISARGKR